MDLVQATSVGVRPEAMLRAQAKHTIHQDRPACPAKTTNVRCPRGLVEWRHLARRTAPGPWATWSWTANRSAFLWLVSIYAAALGTDATNPTTRRSKSTPTLHNSTQCGEIPLPALGLKV